MYYWPDLGAGVPANTNMDTEQRCDLGRGGGYWMPILWWLFDITCTILISLCLLLLCFACILPVNTIFARIWRQQIRRWWRRRSVMQWRALHLSSLKMFVGPSWTNTTQTEARIRWKHADLAHVIATLPHSHYIEVSRLIRGKCMKFWCYWWFEML